MLRVSAAAALTIAGLVAPLPLLASIRVDERKAAIAPNALGTWRLDSLLDQAVVNGIQAGDVDPANYVLHDLRFDDGSTQIVPAKTPFGEVTVEKVDGAWRLAVKGKAGFFRLKVPKTKLSDIGAIACRVRSSGCGEVVVLRDPAQLAQIDQFGGGQGGAGAPPPGPVLPFIPGVGNVQLPQQGGNPFGGPPGMLAGLDPRMLFGGEIVKFAADGEWHNIVRRNGASSRNLGVFGGGQAPPRAGTIEELALIVLPPVAPPPPAPAADPAAADKSDAAAPATAPAPAPEPTAAVDLEFVHLLDSKADYAAATAAPCTIERGRVLHAGLHLNTPSSITWRLVAPAGGKLVAGLGALNDQPFELFVHVTSAKGRETVLRHAFSPPLDPDAPFDQQAIAPIAVDLAPFAGQEIAVEIEVVEETEPNVAFLLQPLIHGKPQGEGPRNVMLYFCDTLRADALSCYGNTRPTTPTLDALAATGIRMERCFSQGAWTYVSMPSSLSSLFPSVNGVRNGGEQISGSVTTVAEAFRAAGYLTAAFIRNDFVGPTTHTEQGFDFFFPGDVIGSPGGNALNQAFANMFGNRGPQNADAGAGGMNFGSGSSRDLYAKVEPWLDQYRDIPFFLYMHAVDPHEPYAPETADRAKFLSKDEDEAFVAMEKKFNDWQQAQQSRQGGMNLGGMNIVIGPGGPVAVAPPAGGPAPVPAADPNAPATDGTAKTAADPTAAPPPAAPPAAPPPAPGRSNGVREMYTAAGVDADDFMRKQRAIYDAEVHYFDRHYRQLRDYFAKHGLTDRTIFSFNADHGEEFLDHGATSHGQSVYAELNHVPWILSASGLLPEGKVVSDNVANVDLGPTLLGLAGVTPPETMQGRNLAAELQAGDELPAMMIVTERWGGGMFGGAGPTAGGEGDYLGEWAVIEGRWKTIVRRSLEAKPGADGKPGAPELKLDLEIYDLHADMTDAKSLIESERPRAEAAAKRLEIWLGEMRKLAARYAGDDTSSDGALDMMRALGYAQ